MHFSSKCASILLSSNGAKILWIFTWNCKIVSECDFIICFCFVFCEWYNLVVDKMDSTNQGTGRVKNYDLRIKAKLYNFE